MEPFPSALVRPSIQRVLQYYELYIALTMEYSYKHMI